MMKDKKGDAEDTEKKSGINISVGGDVNGSITAAEGDIHQTNIGHVDGDYVAGDKVIKGDEVRGNKIEVGDIKDSTGVVIVQGAQTSVSQLIDPFAQARAQLEEIPLSEPEKEDVEGYLDRLETQAQQDEPEQDRVDHCLEKLEKYAPDVVEVLINAILSPGAAVGKGIQTAIRIWREGRKSA